MAWNDKKADEAPASKRTELTKDELKQCLATGTAAADIRDWQSQGFDFEEILDLCNTSAEAIAAAKAGDAKRIAEANDKLQNPGNRTHPGISVYSRPEGDRANPKGQLPYKMTWGGTDLHADLLTAEEFDLVVQIQPGDYRCRRSDNSLLPVTVIRRINEMTNKTERMDIMFKTSGMNRHNLPSMVTMCREMLEAKPVALVG